MTLEIRPLRATDRTAWHPLWSAYLDYYETQVPEAVYASTFARLLSDDPHEFNGLLAVLDEKPVGLVHYLFHRHGWKIENTCYLQDLYTAPAARGQGAGRALIEAVYAAADAAGAPSVYWLTQDFNAPARRLYDQVGQLTPFIKYARSWEMWRALAPLMLVLIPSACASPDMALRDLGLTGARQGNGQVRLPPMKFFPRAPAPRATRPNSEIARDFLDLSFSTESGRQLPILTRFSGPVSLRVMGQKGRKAEAGPLPPTLRRDLDILLARLNREAGIPISWQDTPTTTTATTGAPRAPANITIQIVPRTRFQRDIPQAACFVAPNVSSWGEYRRSAQVRRNSKEVWAALPRRERLAIFIPSDNGPQELRDCLNEELAQALGPINDLYRLPDSIFNDDNFHSVLTGFDMLALRVYYDPALQNGMSADQVAARLPAILARLNPAGARPATRPRVRATPRGWIDLIQRALGPDRGISPRMRRTAALQAVAMARTLGPNDIRLGFALYIYGRMTLASNPDAALAAFAEAGAIFRTRPETRIHAAKVAWQQAVFALSVGNADATIKLANANMAAAREGQKAALLANFMMLKAAALDLEGRPGEVRAVRLDSLGWGRYGFASDRAVRRKLSKINALVPRPIPGQKIHERTGG